MSLGRQIAVAGILGIIVLTVVLGFSSFTTTKENIKRQTFQRLTVIREAKSQHVEDYFFYIKSLLSSLAGSNLTKQALLAFEDGFYRLYQELNPDMDEVRKALEDEYRSHYLNLVNYSIPGSSRRKPLDYYIPKDPNGKIAQYIFIVRNPNPVGKKNLFVYSEEFDCSYMNAHRQFHRDLNNILGKFGLYDIFLIDGNGTVVYTTFKEKDFATNLLSGPYRNTGLARVFREAISSKGREVFFSDFSPYEPSYNQPAAFIASPIVSGGRNIGVIAFQLPIDKIDSIVNFNYRFSDVGLGKTGEVYLVGEDYMLKNNVRFLKRIEEPTVKSAGTTIGVLKVKNEAVERALRGEKGTVITENFLGKRVLTSYGPISILGKRWAIVAEIDSDEVLSGFFSLKKNKLLLISILFLLLIVAAFLLFVKRNIVSPLSRFTDMTRELAKGEGDLTKRLNIEREDELGKAARYFNAFLEKIRLMVERAKESAGRNMEVAEVLRENAKDGKGRIARENEFVERASFIARSISEPIRGFRELISKSESEVEEAVKRLSVARRSIEQLRETIEETGRENLKSAQELKELDRKAESVGNIIGIIKDIADKTNLLALNAAIEAARAGEAGRGFAVVADEIRKLAEQIQKNTADINSILNDIVQSISTTTDSISRANTKNVKYLEKVSREAIGDMEKVNESMGRTSDVSRTIKRTSEEIVNQIESLIENIKDIDSVSKQNAESIENTLKKIDELYREIDELNRLVSAFKTE